jgi:hypothetical protein
MQLHNRHVGGEKVVGEQQYRREKKSIEKNFPVEQNDSDLQ